MHVSFAKLNKNVAEALLASCVHLLKIWRGLLCCLGDNAETVLNMDLAASVM